MKPFSLLFLLPLFLSFLITIHVHASQTLIESTCQTISKDDPNVNYDFCTTSIQAAPASQCANISKLGMISLRLIRDNITDNRCHIKQLTKNKKLDPFVRQCLDDCFELFSDAIPSVKQAMIYYSKKRFGEANIEISSIMDAATTCEDGFSERSDVVSPLSKRNNDTFQLSIVALSIMNLIQTGSG